MAAQRAADSFTYETLNKRYTHGEIAGAPTGTIGDGRDRAIAVETLQQSAVMFHYFTIPDREAGESDYNYARKVTGLLISRYSIPIWWNPANGAWDICFGSSVSKYTYYYPNPCAGFGVDEWGRTFNAGLICNTTRTSRWAYLKSGTHIRNSISAHRREPFATTRDFDYLRLQQCDHLPNNGACADGNYYDICMTHRFRRDNNIDGITAIARSDDIMDITKHGGVYNYNNDKTMFQALESYANNIYVNRQAHGLRYIDYALWTMNLLCMESDLKEGNILNIGFREFANTPFGSRQGRDIIPPRDLPAPFTGRYAIIEENFDGGGECIKRKFRIASDLLLEFIRTYVNPHLLFQPLSLVTPRTIHGVNAPAAADIINIQHAADQDTLRYNLNRNIGTYLNGFMRDDYEDSQLFFDILHNVFYTNNPTIDEPIDIQFTGNPASGHPALLVAPFIDPPHTNRGYFNNYYKYKFNTNRNRLNWFQNIKVLKELFSNKAFETYWISELYLPLILENADGEMNQPIPIGPFYNPLSLPITEFRDMRNVYGRIIELLEAPLGAFTSEIYYILKSADADARDYRAHLQQLLTTVITDERTRNGITNPYYLGSWVLDVYPQATRTVQSGGGNNTVPFNSKQFTNTFKQNWNSYYKNKNKTRKIQSTTTKTNKLTEKVGEKEGHTSSNITNLTKDQEYILDYIQKDEELGKLWKLIFQDSSKLFGPKEPSKNTTSTVKPMNVTVKPNTMHMKLNPHNAGAGQNIRAYRKSYKKYRMSSKSKTRKH